jgi:mono/diheme cytochrome c family protein
VKLLAGILVGLLIALAAAGLFLWSGAFNVAATQPPGKLEESIARFAVNRSVARRATGATNPLAASPDTLRAGLSRYRANCLGCHASPGADAAEYGQGLNPAAPDLTLPRVQRRTDGELYWIVANGIRMTGMPAFAPTHGEEEVWQIVAFMRHLPEISPEEEQDLKVESPAPTPDPHPSGTRP